jgi:predicted RNase H-like HicB family nuclease
VRAYVVEREKKMERFTVIYEHKPPWWIAWVEELPGANTQGRTLEEAMENLQEAIQLILEELREEARRFL